MPETPAKQRVLFICPQPFFEWRGSPIRVKFDALSLSELGYDVDLLTLPIGSEEKIDNVRVIRAWNLFGSKEISIGPSLLKLWFALILLIQATGLVLRNRYDVLHGTEEAGFICYLLAKIGRTKCVFEKHSDSHSYNPKFFLKPVLALYGIAEKLTIKGSNTVISTGPALNEQALEMAGTSDPGNKFYIIPDTPSSNVEASDETITKTRKELINSNDQVLITYAGSFASYQGIDIIFDAIPTIIKQCPQALFIIIGGSKEEIEHHKNALEKMGVSEQIKFLGKVPPDTLTAYLAASDILLAPRKSGVNSPLKILDYFKAGAAIVATNTDANKRLLNTDNAVLSEFDVESFAHAIKQLIESPSERQRIAKNAHKLYESKYNFSVFKSQINEAYNSTLS